MTLIARDLSYEYAGGKRVLDEQSLTLTPGQRIALVGDNGAGKSTLLAILAGELTPDGGAVEKRNDATLGLLAQEPRLDTELTVGEVTRRALAAWHTDIERHAALCAEGSDDEAHLAEISELTERIEARGGFSPDRRADEVRTRFSLPDPNARVSALSGGERRRLDLARLILEAPEVLLLDEPTNHLDRGAVQFLAATLTAHVGPVLFVSHDRAFLDDIATDIVELARGIFHRHDPPYANYVERRVLREDTEARTHHRKQRILAREVAWLRAGVKARTTKQKARIGRAEALIDEVSAEVTAQRKRSLEMVRADTARLGKTVLEIDDLSVGRGERIFFEHMTLNVVAGERWGIVGDNGAGKTTFFRTLLGEHEPVAGEVRRGKNTRLALLDQHRRDLVPTLTMQEYLCPDGGDHVFVGDERLHVASFLEHFLFDPQDRARPLQTLSGGEQNRLYLAKVLSRGDNVLLLDEPTNDLDVTTLGILEEMLLSWEGAAFIISHDRVFLDRTVTGIIALEPASNEAGAERHAVIVQGDYTHYLRTVDERAETRAEAPTTDAAPVAAPQKVKTAKRKRSYKEEQEYQRIEAEVLEAEARKEELDALLADGALFRDDPPRAAALAEELNVIGPRIEALYSRWQELEDLNG